MRIVLLILVPFGVLAIALAGTHILTERLFILIVLLMLAGFLFCHFSLRGIRGQLKNPGQHFLPGQAFQIEAALENQGKWPGNFLKLRLVSGKRRSEKTPLEISPGSVVNWSDRIVFDRRGGYRVGPLVVEASDPLGIISLSRVVDSGQEVIICPATRDLPNFEAEPGLLRNQSLFQEAGAFSGIRDYVPGDSLNRIHWRSSAHTGKLIVKEFEVDRSERIWVLPDLDKRYAAGSGAETTTEYIISAAASIIKKYSLAGRPVGLVAQNAAYYYYPARSGNLNMWRMMEALAVMQADGSVPLPRVLYRTREQLSGNAVVILVTASDHDEIADSLISAGRQGLRTVVVLVDAASFGGAGSPLKLQRRLSAQNIPVYLVRQGNDLAEELNSRKTGTLPSSASGGA